MVKPKKYLGQHFLKDESIASKIAESLTGHNDYPYLLEIGPGMGVLSKFLVPKDEELTLIEIDRESIDFLKNQSEYKGIKIIEGDFLKIDLSQFKSEKWGIVGNFPYNISSQIFFRILDLRSSVMEVVCMLQKEVAERICSPPGNKKYGILSVFLQAYFEVEYLFEVSPSVFHPPPKVDSAVIRLKRNSVEHLDCNEDLFRAIVKRGFQNRRKTLRNALKPLNLPAINVGFDKSSSRAEELSVADYINLTKLAEEHGPDHSI